MFSCVTVHALFYLVHIAIVISDIGFYFSSKTGLLVVSQSMSLNSLFGERRFVVGCRYCLYFHKFSINYQMATDTKPQQGRGRAEIAVGGEKP